MHNPHLGESKTSGMIGGTTSITSLPPREIIVAVDYNDNPAFTALFNYTSRLLLRPATFSIAKSRKTCAGADANG